VKRHIELLGLMFTIYGVMGVIGALVVATIFVGGGMFAGRAAGEPDVTLMASAFGTVLTFVILITTIPCLIAGYGLLKRRPWSRVLALVIGIINIPGIPFGTALGIYAIWVLVQDDAVKLLESSPARPS
jgi:hypothetical protein